MSTAEAHYVLFPIQYHNIWDMYKVLEGSFWTVEDVLGVDRVASSNLDAGQAVRLLSFVGASHAHPAAAVVTALCPAGEFNCFLGLQGFLECVHLEGAARIVNEAVPVIAQNAEAIEWTAAELGGDADPKPQLRLLYCVAFWAAWTAALEEWRARLQSPVHSGMDALTTNMLHDGRLFVRFAIEMLCSICGTEEITADAATEALKKYYVKLVGEMTGVLSVACDVAAGWQALNNDILFALRAPREITLRKKREHSDALEMSAEF